MWGPLLMKYEIDNEIIQGLNQKGDTLSKKFNSHLAGHIKEEYQYDNNDVQWLAEKISPYFNHYLKNHYEWLNIKEKNIKQIHIETLWINYMKPGEFNPPHTHNEYDMSFVIYTDVPKEIEEENKNYVGTSGGPGTIEFMIGQNFPKGFGSMHNFLPKTGEMFVFPSRLTHFVCPFLSKVTRKSVSGNCWFVE